MQQEFWNRVPGQFGNLGPPLRPCADDIVVMQRAVRHWAQSSGTGRCDALLCGVTPEIANMDWPAGIRLWAADRSRGMIRKVWPGHGCPGRQVLQAEWTMLPFSAGSLDIVIGDGCLTAMQYPSQQSRFLEAAHTVLRPGGRLILRAFVQPEHQERPGEVFDDVRAGLIGGFHAFKWRLAMALQESPTVGVCVGDIWDAWQAAGIETGFPPESVATIDLYRGSRDRLAFATLAETRAQLAGRFIELDCMTQSYELGERCPVLVLEPRRSTAGGGGPE